MKRKKEKLNRDWTYSIMLKQQLQKELVESLKSGDKLKRLVLSGLLTAIKNKELSKRTQISKTAGDIKKLEEQSLLNDEEVLEIIAGEVKKRKDSTEQFKGGGRDDLAEKEKAEGKILTAYLPQQLTDDEIRREVKDAISLLNAKSPQDTGKVIGAVMAKIKGRADGSAVSRIVKECLT